MQSSLRTFKRIITRYLANARNDLAMNHQESFDGNEQKSTRQVGSQLITPSLKLLNNAPVEELRLAILRRQFLTNVSFNPRGYKSASKVLVPSP